MKRGPHLKTLIPILEVDPMIGGGGFLFAIDSLEFLVSSFQPGTGLLHFV